MDAESSAESLSVASIDGEGWITNLAWNQRPCHRHPLEQLSVEPGHTWFCDICKMELAGEGIWGCTEEDCFFNAHIRCIDCLYEEVKSYNPAIEKWRLDPRNVADKACEVCNSPALYQGLRIVDGTIAFRCIVCVRFGYLVDQHRDVTRVKHHFFHPCELSLVYSPSTTCNACFLSHDEFYYHCKDCNFFLAYECALLPRDFLGEIEDDFKHLLIDHFCHWHTLQPSSDEETLCGICESPSSSSTSNSFYGCYPCNFYVHKLCIDILPWKAIHPSLDQTVVLQTVSSCVCATCDRACSWFAFSYKGCYYCVKCILWPGNEFGGYGGFESIHHRHELTIGEVDKACCFMCGRDCSGWNYECNKCSVCFHKSCAELPRELQHGIHLRHSLTLTVLDTNKHVRCNLCHKALQECSLYGRVYRCCICDFYLDSSCASMSFIQYQEHPHLLRVVDSLSDIEARCNKCSVTLPRDSPVVQCAECEFGLHLECGPLPCIIKDRRHVHPLALKEYYVEDSNMSDKFACHICEKERNPRLPVYVCTEGCLMICEVKCFQTEVATMLRGERGVLELDTVYPKVACKMIARAILKEITCDGSGENDEDVGTEVPVFAWRELCQLAKPYKLSDFEDVYENEPLEEGSMYRYSRKAFERFIKNIEGIDVDPAVLDEIHSKYDGSHYGGDYLLPNALHSVYNNFFEEHIIFGSECKLDHDDKRLIVFTICSVLHDMRMTKVVDVSKERLASWYSHLRFIQAKYRHEGLELDFLFNQLNRIAEDHYLVKSVDIIEAEFSELCKKKEGLFKMKAWLARKVAENESKIEENKEELRSFRAYRYAGAHELKKEYFASLESKWRPCYEF